ncbi:uncharacterized protein DUF3617 [Onishia taeanensis]|uniref:Uncharacterized protein DUF3617 n=1 Tax=Onishia taeanensis TaxID=284577 RepID=A0A328Y1R6_9GAMM|nr:DUF3617 family protein [Halomonas taeanensis]RAR64724.1 uncharacterized protein DUF3617 [Halomonas taeanensis]
MPAIVLLFVAALLMLPLPVMAQGGAPNLVPGMWAFSSMTHVEGDLPIPDQTESHQECLTEADIADAQRSMIQEQDGCEVIESTIGRDRMDYRMMCRGSGGEANIDGNMRFLGERAEGSVDIDTTTPMGELKMHTTIEAQRMGEC